MKKLRTSYKGRRCKYPNCKVRLSIYNHQEYCHVHKRMLIRQGKLKESRF